MRCDVFYVLHSYQCYLCLQQLGIDRHELKLSMQNVTEPPSYFTYLMFSFTLSVILPSAWWAEPTGSSCVVDYAHLDLNYACVRLSSSSVVCDVMYCS